jgi:hypothetical protein
MSRRLRILLSAMFVCVLSVISAVRAGGFQNSHFDVMPDVSAAEALKYAKAAIDSRQIR